MKFVITYKFSNHGINKLIQLLGKSVCPYEYMNDWEKINETLLLEKGNFHISRNMEGITDAD